MAFRRDGILLSPGPGDPSRLEPVVGAVRELLGRRPMFGICLGNQLLCHAIGGKTYKLKFGHRGSNHPVKDLRTGKVTITSQNHGYADDPVSIEGTGAEARGTVAVTLSEAPGNVTIRVADDGIGLPVERDRIAEPYMTTRARGTGLGLAIVKKIIEEHGGTIGFSDRAGGGTVVTVAFDTALLAALDRDDAADLPTAGEPLAALTRSRG